MSKKRSSTTSSTSTSALDPWQRQQWEGLYGKAKEIADKPYVAYTGPGIAGFNADQTGAFDIVRNAVSNNVGGATLNDAIAGTRKAMSYTPQTITAESYKPATFTAANAGPAAQMTSQGYNAATFDGASAGEAATAEAASINRGDIRDVEAGSILDKDIGAYMNPFLQNVAGNTMRDLERTRQIQMIQGGNAARAAGAFGGSRHGVADAETNRNFFDIAGNKLTDLYATGFNNATSLATGDLTRSMDAAKANQGVDYNVASTNAGFTQDANLSNRDSINKRAEFNAGLLQEAGLSNRDAINAASRFTAEAANTASGKNMDATNNMAQFNANLEQEAGLSNRDAINTAERYNADNRMTAQTTNATNAYNAANLGLSASNQLANLSDKERRNVAENAALLESIGDKQQGQTQREYDYARKEWEDAQNEDLRDLGIQASVLGSMPTLGQTTTGTSTTTQKPSTADTIGQTLNTVGNIASFMKSDRNVKSGIKKVDEDRILRGIEKTPVSSWRYDPAKGGPNDGGRRHTGPMAQDVAKNLGLGNGKMIPVVDAIGTQFAATKALAKKVKKLEAKTKKGKK
jgi:Chaperone of endosialidase